MLKASTVVGECDLFAVHDGFECRPHGDLGLAVANVAAQQAIHRRRRFHVALDVPDGRRLIGGQLVGKRAFEFLLPVRIRREGAARDRLPLRVRFSSSSAMSRIAFLTRVLAFSTSCRRGGRGLDAIRRCIALNEIEALDGDEQLVVAVIAKLEKLLQTGTATAAPSARSW